MSTEHSDELTDGDIDFGPDCIPPRQLMASMFDHYGLRIIDEAYLEERKAYEARSPLKGEEGPGDA